MEQEKVTGSMAVEYFGKQLVGENFTLDPPGHPHYRQIYQDLYYYFAGKKEGRLNPDKCLMIVGDKGVGKGISMRIMNRIFRRFVMVHAKRDLERGVKDREIGEVGIMDRYGYSLKKDLYIDEIGAEETVLVYGNSVPVIGQLLLDRYDLWQESKFKTHITTNLSHESLEARYGDRVFDRFFEMYNPIIHWTGPSLRNPKMNNG